MLTKRIIPCLDVDAGRVVKGVSFVDLRDAGDPVEMALFYDRAGADELVFLDITASVDARDIMVEVVRQVSEQLFIPLTVGGGLRSLEQIRVILEAGADKVSLNTSAVLDPQLVQDAATRFGSQCIVVAVDAKRTTSPLPYRSYIDAETLELTESSKWEVFTHGGKNASGFDAITWARKVVSLGAGEILLTSMDSDGHQDGYDVELTKEVSESVSVPVIASGGAGSPEHLHEVLDYGKADAALAASIFHYGTWQISQVKSYLSLHGIPIRPLYTSLS